MSQTNFTPILIYASNTATSVPSAGNLTNSANGAEIAVNTADKRLFTKDLGGAVVELGTNPSSLSLPNQTANGVLYLNGSKVATSGSALTFDGTNFTTTGYAAGNGLRSLGGNPVRFYNSANSNWSQIIAPAGTGDMQFDTGAGEQMRLTSTGLGIGTSSPAYKLDVLGVGKASSAFAVGDSSGNLSGTFTNESDVSKSVTFNADPGNVGASSFMRWNVDGSEHMRLDSSGNLGLGVTPSAWSSSVAAQVGYGAALSSRAAGSTASDMTHGAYWNGTNWLYQYSSVGAARYQMTGANSGSTHAWFVSAGGTAGNAISFTQALTLDADRNLLLNGTTAGASSVGTFTIFNGTAPTGSVTDGVILFAQDIASSSELRVRDEAGNVTTLSPHNFSLIPEGPSEEMAWAYYSEKGGKRINVDMLKLARMVEKLTGEKLVYEV